MIVAGDSKVSSVANVSAELKVVIAYNLRPVIDKLELIFGFQKRTVASVHTETIPEIAKTPILRDLTYVSPITA